MKLILLHGSFQEAALKKISQIKKGFDPLSITEFSDTGMGFNFSSPNLFSEKRLIVLENPDLKTIDKALEEKDPDLTVLIKFNKQLEKTSPILKKVIEAKGEILTFDENNQPSIFPLLDMLGNLNYQAYAEFEKNYPGFGGQYILAMLAYFLRRMVVMPKSTSEYMRQKIAAQKKNFSLEKIKALYKEIIEVDFQIKQGLLEEKLGLTLLIEKILVYS